MQRDEQPEGQSNKLHSNKIEKNLRAIYEGRVWYPYTIDYYSPPKIFINHYWLGGGG